MVENGVAFPPFYFLQSGVHEFLTAVKDRVPLSRAPNDPDLFLVDEQSLKLSHSVETLLPETKDNKRTTLPIRTKTVTDRINEASWAVLEGFARVANFYRAPASASPSSSSSAMPSSSSADDFEVINPPPSKVWPPESIACISVAVPPPFRTLSLFLQ
jgi:hypothetical protein